jgi:uncharacterized protein with von Willebrand factor type A (vWA) domain
MVDLSLSMPMRGNFLPAKKVTMALHALITSKYPRDYLGLVGFSRSAEELKAEQLPEVSWDFDYGTNMHEGFMIARRLLAKQSGTKQIIMITDGEPTAHVMPNGQIFFDYPTRPETRDATLRQVMLCTKEDIVINTFMLDADHGLRSFVEKLTSINRGRAFFTVAHRLDAVTVDTLQDEVVGDGLGATLAHSAGQVLGAHVAGHDADLAFCLCKSGTFICVDEIAGQCSLKSTGIANAIDSCNPWYR